MLAALAVVWLGALSVGCWRLIRSDWRSRTLHNADVAFVDVMALVGAIGGAIASGQSIIIPVAAALVAFAVLAAGYAAGLLGGGDAKVVVAPALLMAGASAPSWLVFLAVAVVVGSATVIGWARAAPDQRGRGLPLGPLLLAGLPPAMLVELILGF
ncbi:MAG: hypothetical protein AAF467_17595 [Actinomycetota bacterium]